MPNPATDAVAPLRTATTKTSTRNVSGSSVIVTVGVYRTRTQSACCSSSALLLTFARPVPSGLTVKSSRAPDAVPTNVMRPSGDQP